MTADSPSISQLGNTGLTSIHDQHLSQCIQLKQNFLNNSTANIYQSLTSNLQLNRIDDDILFADGNDVTEVQVRNSNCECGHCPQPNSKSKDDTLSDLQRSVAKCSCGACNSNGDILNYYRNCSNQNSDTGIVHCDTCNKQKISLSNFRALQITARLDIDNDREIAGEEDLCREIELSLNMEDSEHRKTHNRHSADSISTGIDLSQFCQCEFEGSKRKTSSVDEIFKMADGSGSLSDGKEDEEMKTSQRQRSLSDSQRDKAKVDNKGEISVLNGLFIFSLT